MELLSWPEQFEDIKNSRPPFFQQLQHVRGCIRFPKTRKDSFHAVTMGIGVAVCHCIDDENDIVAVIVRAASCGFHAGACRDTRQENLRYAALAQVIIQGCADECAHALLGDKVVVRLLLQFRDKFSPIGRKRKVARPGVSAARSWGSYVHENDGQPSFSEHTRELGSASDDLAGWVNGWYTNNSLFAGRSRLRQRHHRVLRAA